LITILLFANLQEEIGTNQLNINLDNKELNVLHIKEWLKKTYHLQSLNQVMIAINECYATDDVVVSDGDTIAFIPPVSGG